MRFIFVAFLIFMCAPVMAESYIVPPFAEMNRSCATAADCVVQDVGSCCGYNPQCVNREQMVDADGVARQCARDGISGVCGFTPVEACACIENKCTGVSAAPKDAGE
jgi:hypothetical protein